MIKYNKGQEEMIGFALIIIIVAVILLVFLTLSLRNKSKEGVESYEVESFIQAVLQYTTECRDSNDLEFLSIQKLIFDCSNEEQCLDERNSCEVLNSELANIIEESWQVGEDRPVKGYSLKITENEVEEVLPVIEQGNITANYKTGVQDFSKPGKTIEIFFTAYY